jgi:hypothetical protein
MRNARFQAKRCRAQEKPGKGRTLRKPDEKIATGTTRDSMAALVNSENPWLSEDVTSRMLSVPFWS